ncbi:MAG TPA: RimK family alpha-L-glutamate ligase [Deferribacteraceae bacterium]|nr:RimK family alpha-L-glutamate ligase [Deferribacteraceae bacterium]
MTNLIVVNTPSEWKFDTPDARVVSAWNYLTDPEFNTMKKAKVFNLCRSYQYQSYGYYVSLLAAARGHMPYPNVMTIQDFKSKAFAKLISDEIDELIQKSLHHLTSENFTLSIYFGRNLAKRYDKLSSRLFGMFVAPMVRADFIKVKEKWMIHSIAPISMKQVPEEHFGFVEQAACDFFVRTPRATHKKNYRFDLAILTNASEKTPPSDDVAIQRFIKAAEKEGVSTEIISKDDYNRIPEFDALFIRETTSVNHHTYRFSRKAETEGLVVIDDPTSILRCTNKVYLSELMQKNKIPTPKTTILHRHNMNHAKKVLPFPIILKQPDSSFSQGVVKVNDEKEYKEAMEKLLDKSALVVAQEFMPTSFDWRVGVIGGKALYVCRYFMHGDHWQIVECDENGQLHNGTFDTMPVEDAPAGAVELALKATKCVGNSLYGVDIKQVGNKFYVIEVNDNPSIESDVEDNVLGKKLYEIIIGEFVNRLVARKVK